MSTQNDIRQDIEAGGRQLHQRRLGHSSRRARMPMFVTLVVAVVVGASVSMTGVGNAAHRKGTYGNHGYVWFARYNDFAVADVTSSYCNGRELAAYSKIQASTKGASYMRSRWPSGIRLRRSATHSCDYVKAREVDIALYYDPDFLRTHGDYGGENHSDLAPSSWCSAMGASYPCGYHVSRVHLNKSRFTSSRYSNAYRERLIMHETGHSLGLAHHCSSDAIMNDGRAGCNGGRWTQVMGYQSTDRKGIYETYPGWRY